MRYAINFVLALLLLAGCAARQPEPPPTQDPAPQTPSHAQPPSSQPAPSPTPAWEKLLDSGSADLFYAAPDGLIFGPSYEGDLYHVNLADRTVTELSTKAHSFTIGSYSIQVTIADTPYGPMLVGESLGYPSLSPDGTRLAIGGEGLWVADLATGTLSRIGSEPQAPPRPLNKHETWDWAAFPAWSADGKWLEFYSSRLEPGGYTRWRIPAEGGAEELVSREDTGPFKRAVLPDGRMVRVEYDQALLYPAGGGEPQVVGSVGPGSNSLSPDGRWVATLKEDRSGLIVYDVMAGQRREIAVPTWSGPMLTDHWHDSRLIVEDRPDHFDSPSFLSVLDAATGSLTRYAAPFPVGDYPYHLGFTADGRPLARIIPLDAMAGEADERSGVWVLNTEAYTPPTAAVPTALRSARLRGPGPNWEQSLQGGAVTGGTVVGRPDSHLLLQFDQPLGADWMRQSVEVEGKARLEVNGAPLGLAIIRMEGAALGDVVRVRVPSLGFDLELKVAAE